MWGHALVLTRVLPRSLEPRTFVFTSHLDDHLTLGAGIWHFPQWVLKVNPGLPTLKVISWLCKVLEPVICKELLQLNNPKTKHPVEKWALTFKRDLSFLQRRCADGQQAREKMLMRMQTKPQSHTYLHGYSFKKWTITKAGVAIEKSDPLYMLVGLRNGAAAWKYSLVLPQNGKELPCGPSSHFRVYETLKWSWKQVLTQTYVHDVQSSTFTRNER